MLRQIQDLNEMEGKIIKGFYLTSDDLTIVFTDETFMHFVADLGCLDESPEMHFKQLHIEDIGPNLIKLGIATQEEINDYYDKKKAIAKQNREKIEYLTYLELEAKVRGKD